VYALLSEHDLEQYYRLERSPGISLRGKRQARYAWLDDPELEEQILDFRSETLGKVTLHLPQIHCSSCIYLLEHLYRLDPGVLSSKVHFLRREASIAFDPRQTSLRKLVELLDLIGYAPELSLRSLSREEAPPAVERAFYYKLGIAGFAFGNIMLLSFPEYLGLEEAWIARWFGALNLLLSLPVVFYSGSDYLRSAWQGLRQRSLSIDVPIALGMLALWGRSSFEILAQTGAGYLDSLAGLVFFLLVGRWFQRKTWHRLSFERDYRSYFPVAATVLTSEGPQERPLHRLVRGDRILVRHQELIPADGLLTKGTGRIDYSFVTGESEPVSVPAGEKVFGGGRQTGGAVEITLTREVSQSYLLRLWEDARERPHARPLQTISDRVGRWFTLGVLLIAFATLGYWLPRDVGLAFNAFTAVLIIACPCAVALSIPFTFGNVLRLLAREGFFLRDTGVVEAFRRLDDVVFDKTGTLTLRRDQTIRYEGRPLDPEHLAALKALVEPSGHPHSLRIRQWLAEHFPETPTAPLEREGWEEVPGKGLEARIGGRRVALGAPDFAAPAQAERFSGRTVFSIEGQPVGAFVLEHHKRPGLEGVVSFFRSFARVHLLSGDSERERARFEPLFAGSGAVRFGQSPRDKLEFVRGLQSEGRRVAMLGDGLNDAGALKQSDLGIVVADASNNFTPACDAILEAGRFGELPRLVRFARASSGVVFFSYFLALIYNGVGLSFAVRGALSPVIAAILMPLSSITIAVVGVVGTGLLWRLLRQLRYSPHGATDLPQG